VVPPEHEVWVLRELVERMFASTFRSRCTDYGGVPYDPARLLSGVMYGFMNGVHSTRGLESACRYDVRFWVLTGQTVPDHNTIHRFLCRMRDLLPQMMATVSDEARSKGLLRMRVVAVDGTKVAANVSAWHNMVSLLTEDEEPALQKDRKGRVFRGFNGQLAVDADSGMIVGEALMPDATDQHAMPDVLASIERTTGTRPDVVIADKGYDSGSTHTLLADKGVLGIVIPQGKSASFWKLNEKDEPVCPRGFVPVRKGGYRRKEQRWLRFVVRQCKGCPLQVQCGSRSGKTIYVPEGTRIADRIRNAARFEEEEIQKLARTRGPTVELLFARLKARYGITRFSYRQRSKAHAQFRIFCLAENIRRLLRAIFGFEFTVQAIYNGLWHRLKLRQAFHRPRFTSP
jgi:transposase